MTFLLALAACVLGFLGLRQSSAARRDVAALRALLSARERPLGADAGALAGADLETEPAVEVAPVVADLPDVPVAAMSRDSIDIEMLLTQRWGVWLGAGALLLAGVFLVRTAVLEGWLGPALRCLSAGLSGCALVAGAEWMRRRPPGRLPMVDYVPAALAAGGVATWFSAAYGAGPLYGLVPAPLAFLLLGAASLAGLGLSLRFGWLVAAVGLAAGFATPALVVTDAPSLPGLFLYLLLVSAASWAVVRFTAWIWLGWAASLGGAIWVMVVALAPADSGLWAAGLFVPAAVAVSLTLLPAAALEHATGRRFAWLPMVLLGAAGLLMVARTGDDWVRLGMLLLAGIAMAKAWTDPRLAWLPMLSAGFSILTLLAWAVPSWRPTGENVRIEGVLQAVLPGAWAPTEIVPLLLTAAVVALVHAVAGLVGERMRPRPLPWAALTAVVPVLVLAVAYAQVGRFQPEAAWAVAAGLLAGGLVVAATLARPVSVQRAGVHAAGAVAALALGCAVVLSDAWLTVAIALLLPGLAWIEGAAGLPALRRVALAVAGLVLARLMVNPAVVFYPMGGMPVLNGLLVAYGLPAACFAAASVLFRRRGDDLVVAVLEAGACAFVAVLLVAEVRHATQGGTLRGPKPGLAELAWQVTLLGGFAAALQRLGQRFRRPVLEGAWQMVGLVALMGGGVLLGWVPYLKAGEVGQGVLLNALLPAYLLPAVLAVVVRWGQDRAVMGLLGAYALAAGLVWIMASVRQWFGPTLPGFWDRPFLGAELSVLSLALLAFAAGLTAAGMAVRARELRLAGLSIMTLVVGKVFLVDLAGLDGLWRVLSFLGLGLSLIGMGAFYRRFGVER